MTIDELILEVKQWLEESKGEDGVDDDTGELPEPRRGYVAERLMNVEDHIAALRDPNLEPSLHPADVGDIIGSYDPQTTAEYASDALTLADEAHKESLRSSPSHQYIGDRIATISSLLLPGYRSSAGI